MSSVLLMLCHCWLGDSEGHPARKTLGVGLLVVTIWLELIKYYASLTAPVITTTSILSSSKIQNGDILVLTYLGCPGKQPLD